MDLWRWFFLLSALIAVGCGGATTVAPTEESPLTIEEWKHLPIQLKYEIETFERLKRGNPKLQEQRAWDQFSREVILPSKKKDIPGVK